ncbi:MAG: hypothetical protein RLZ07_61 [Pseudomonadota bacterium]|jgi:EAL domain-containing protein (putative c-di-GMP-specific phosphodiesterase class I)
MASTLSKWISHRAEMLIVGAFSVAFVLGFGLFAATGSLELAAAAIGIGAIGVPAVLRQIISVPQKASEEATLESRVKFLELAQQTAEVRLVALESKAPAVTQSDLDRLSLKIGALEAKLTAIDLKSRERASVELAAPHLKPHKILDERRLRKLLSTGQVKIEPLDIESRLVARVAYRHVTMKCVDQGSRDLSESDLRAASVSDDVIKLFDRVRLALTYNLALQVAPKIDGPIHLCPIGKEILSDPQGVADIRGLVERSPAVKQKIGLILSHEPLKYAALRLPVLMKSLQQAGFLVGLTLDEELIAAPSDLVRLNPNFVMIPGAVMSEALRQPSQLAIHPADLIALFERGGIDMIAVDLKTEEHLKAVESLGIHFSETSTVRPVEKAKAQPQPQKSQALSDLKSIFEDHHSDEIMQAIELRPASLRERLQRRSA